MQCLILGLCVAALVACGGGKKAGTQPAGSVAVSAYAAARWIPGKASYAVTARTVRAAQQGVRDLVDTFGMAAGVTMTEVSRELEQLLRVDPLSADALAQIGIDVDGGFAVFSDHVNPTIVVRLASPPAFQAFVERQNLRVQSVVTAGTEIFTAPLPGRARISWAIADSWLWVHFSLPGVPDDSATWFASSRSPGTPAWSADFAFAADAAPPVAGFVDVPRFLADASARVPELAQCMGQLQLGTAGIGRLVLALSADPKQANARVALEVGATTAAGIASAVLPVPEGWQTVTAQVPIAAQWNLDLAAVRARAEPCLKVLDVDMRTFDELGVRAGRGFLRTFDGDKGTGAVALDLAHKDFLAAKLDDIPMRSALERKRTFGPHAGKSLAIPMFLTVDYVLTDHLAFAGVGDGLLVQLVGKGGMTPTPIVAGIAVQPLGLSVESWSALLEVLDVPRAERVAERLHRWSDARVNLTIEGTRLVLTATGTRR